MQLIREINDLRKEISYLKHDKQLGLQRTELGEGAAAAGEGSVGCCTGVNFCVRFALKGVWVSVAMSDSENEPRILRGFFWQAQFSRK